MKKIVINRNASLLLLYVVEICVSKSVEFNNEWLIRNVFWSWFNLQVVFFSLINEFKIKFQI